MSDRKRNEEDYRRLQVEGNELKNAMICNRLADDSLMWNPEEAIYWRKKAIKKLEEINGKRNIENTVSYDKLVNDLMEKGSYKEAVKWNNRSLKIKLKELGVDSSKTIVNSLYKIELDLLLKKYEEIADGIDKIILTLQNHQDIALSELYDIYLKLIYIEGSYNIYAINHNESTLSHIDEFSDKAIMISNKIYGENSIQTVEAYRLKAVCSDKNSEYRLKKKKKAILLAINNEGFNGENVIRIFYNIRQCWKNEDCWKESAKWAIENVSRTFLLNIMKRFPEYAQEIINDVLEDNDP